MIIKNNFQGELTDIPPRKETLKLVSCFSVLRLDFILGWCFAFGGVKDKMKYIRARKCCALFVGPGLQALLQYYLVVPDPV